MRNGNSTPTYGPQSQTHCVNDEKRGKLNAEQSRAAVGSVACLCPPLTSQHPKNIYIWLCEAKTVYKARKCSVDVWDRKTRNAKASRLTYHAFLKAKTALACTHHLRSVSLSIFFPLTYTVPIADKYIPSTQCHQQRKLANHSIDTQWIFIRHIDISRRQTACPV